jgi:hypothetical protein
MKLLGELWRNTEMTYRDRIRFLGLFVDSVTLLLYSRIRFSIWASQSSLSGFLLFSIARGVLFVL